MGDLMFPKMLFVLLSAVVALIINFLLGTFMLRLPFTICFFFILFLFYDYLYSSKNAEEATAKNSQHKFYEQIPYFIGLFGTLLIIFLPASDISIFNTSIYETFASLTPLSLVRIIFGFYLIGVLPGYAVTNAFLKNYGFSLFEKLGLILALSYSLSALLGLLLSYFTILSLSTYLTLLWLLVSLLVTFKFALKRNRDETPSPRFHLPEFCFLSLVFAVLLLGSYGVVSSSGPLTGITAGDISRYISFSNSFFSLGLSQSMPWLLSYLNLGSLLTGLPLIYVYACIQYLVLIIPCSVYFFMRTLFPELRKAAAVSAFMVSLLYGMSSLPFIAKLMGSPMLFREYMAGDIAGALRKFTDIFYANTQSSVLWNRTLEFGLFFFSMAFFFRYLLSSEKRDVKNLFFGLLLINAAVFTHSAFLTLVAVGTIMLFSLVHKVSKRKVLYIAGGGFSLFMFFDLISNSVVPGNFVIQYIFMRYTIPNFVSGSGLNFIMFLFLAVLAYLLLFFREKFSHKLNLATGLGHLKNKWEMPDFNRFGFSLWISGFLIVVVSLILCFIYYDDLHFVNMSFLQPWYVWIAYWGLQVPLVVGGLRYFLKHKNEASVQFLGSFAVVVFGAFVLFSSGGIPTLEAGYGTHYLFFMSYPLSLLASIVLVKLFRPMNGVKAKRQINILLFKKVSLNRNKIGCCLLLVFLVISMSASFLSYSLSVATYYPIDGFNPRFSISDTEILQWSHKNLPRDSVVVALSRTSYQMLSSILPNKILPIFLGSEGPEGGTWARNAIMESQLSEAVLSSLYQLGATHVFVGSADYTSLLESNTTFASLLKLFPVAYASEDVKLYEVPKVLYEDSNYHLVSGLWDYPVTEQTFTFEKDYSPIDISDDDQSTFWNARAIREGTGSMGVPILSDDSLQNINGTDSLKIEVTSGTYGAWQINHKYESLQDWSSQDYIAFYWYGSNTGKTLSLEIQSDIASYNYYRYDFTENWTGWKRVVVPLQNPTEASTIEPDLTRIDQMTLGFWLSSNVNGTFWLDRVTVDVGQWIEQDSTVPSNQLVTEMLLSESVPYSVVSEDNLSTLIPGEVYFFTYNPYLSQDLLNNLNSFISEGAHVIFTNSMFASYNENWQQSYSLPSIMNYTIIPITSTDVMSEIIYDECTFNCSVLLSHNISFENESELEIIASFKLSDNSTVPYIVQETVGNGSITFIDLNSLAELPDSSRNEVLNITMQSLLNLLPEPFEAKVQQDLPIPSQTFADIAFRGSTYDLWRNEDLRGNLMFHGGINIQGDFSILSDYLYCICDQLYVENMQITQIDKTDIITEPILYDVKILGAGELSFSSSKAELPNYPTGLYNIINVTSDSNGSLQSIELTDATITFKRTADGESEIYNGDLMITAYSANSLTIRAKQPQLILNGSVEGIIHGAFIYNRYYFYSRAQQSFIKGNFTLDVLYSSGITFTQLGEIRNILEIKTDAN